MLIEGVADASAVELSHEKEVARSTTSRVHGLTSWLRTYLQGIDRSEIITTVQRDPPPVLPVSAGLHEPAPRRASDQGPPDHRVHALLACMESGSLGPRRPLWRPRRAALRFADGLLMWSASAVRCSRTWGR